MTNRAERNKKIGQSLKAKRARGEVSGRLPIGYQRLVGEDGVSRLVKDDHKQLLIEIARRLHDQGLSLRKIAVVLYPLGLKTRKGLPLTAATLWRAIRTHASIK